jgi:type II secretory pathway pseudopilin PulG
MLKYLSKSRTSPFFQKLTSFFDAKNNNGQSLVEVVVSLALAILVLGGLINAVVASLRNSSYAKNQAQATKLAQQRMEWMRINRDTYGWSTFPKLEGTQTYVSGGCYSISNSPPVLNKFNDFGCSGTDPVLISTPGFAEKISILDIDCGSGDICRKQVTISVFWTDGSCQTSYCHKSELISFLSRWQ